MIDAVNNSVLEVLTDVDKHLKENNDLFIDSVETESKKKTGKKFWKKKKSKATLPTAPNKFQLKHLYSKRVRTRADMMNQFYCARKTWETLKKITQCQQQIRQIRKLPAFKHPVT